MTALHLVFAATTAAAALAAAPSPSFGDVTWLSPTPFDGASYADGMPLGNGHTVVLAWANTTAGGVDFFVRSPMAMHLDSQLYTIAKLSVVLSPNPFTPGAYFNQSHHLADASVVVLVGGTSLADYVASVSLYVDANDDFIIVSVASRAGAGALLSLSVTMSSVRPATRNAYKLDFQCDESSSGPDVLVQGALPAPAPASSVALYHVNSVASGDTSLFNSSMRLQGLASLISAGFSDPLEGRIFGVGITAASADASGTPFVRVSPTTLASAAPSSAFLVAVVVRVDALAGGDADAWLAGLALSLSTVLMAPEARAAASAAWWTAFWSRSYISLPPSAPPPPKIGVFPCGGAARADQILALDQATGLVTLPGGLCFAPSSDGNVVIPGPCVPGAGWALTPCTAQGCTAGEFWVRSQAQALVLGLPGATCPWIDVWSPDDPTGVEKNELWAWNATDNTLRSLCLNCPSQCVTVGDGTPAPPLVPSVLAAQYARTRFLQAVQSRGHNVPIKFNGLLYTTQAGTKGPVDVDYRQWGPDHWWQNTRLPYGAQLIAGDFDTMRVLLDWVVSFFDLAAARSKLLLGYDDGSIFFTETVNAFGLYQGTEYGCDPSTRPAGYPVWLEGPGDEGGWVRYDFGGNGIGLEAGLMAVDYYFKTLDRASAALYIPIATRTLAFYMNHYTNRTDDGKFLLWPTQVLESFWCEWPGWSNCCENDMPQLSGLTALVGAVLSLPTDLDVVTPAQRAAYVALSAILPPLPLSPDGTQYAPAAVVSSGTHNSEVPELFNSHPFRLITAGRAAVAAVNLSIGRATWQALPLAKANTGWYYGGIDASLLGLANESYAMVMDRAVQPPPSGYRWPAFAQHYQDYEPSADHYANLMTALQLQLIQLGEDGMTGTMVLLPSWPCTQDVSFKLFGTLNTTVEVVFAAGKLVSLDVEPRVRASAVVFGACVSRSEAAAAVRAVLARA